MFFPGWENEGKMYRTCTVCGREWDSREQFLSDPQVKLIGYQVSFRDLSEGFFLFNHEATGCNTTMAIDAGHFFDLYEGPMFEGRMRGTKECPGYCLHKSELARCPIQCECAFVREVLQLIVAWPKKAE